MSHHIFEPRSSFGIHQKRKKDASSLSPATSIITFELLPNPDWSDKIFIASHDINPVSDREIPHNEKPLFGGTLSTAASTATEAKTDSLPNITADIWLGPTTNGGLHRQQSKSHWHPLANTIPGKEEQGQLKPPALLVLILDTWSNIHVAIM